jgi:hypothetical protein
MSKVPQNAILYIAQKERKRAHSSNTLSPANQHEDDRDSNDDDYSERTSILKTIKDRDLQRFQDLLRYVISLCNIIQRCTSND